MQFLDIFSKKKINETKKSPILVDHREKNSLVVSELISLGNKLIFEQLEVGDYVINNIAIERKTSSDLINSVIDKRIYSQIENLKKYQSHIIIIEKDNQKIRLNEKIKKGILLSLLLKQKVPLIYSENEKDTAQYLNIIANKKERKISLREHKKAKTIQEEAEFILEGIPKIGPVRAKKLINEFKTLKNILNASKEDLAKILGKDSEKIHALFNLEI